MNTVQSDSYAANAYAQNTTKTQKEDTSATKKSSQTKNYGKTIGGAEAFRTKLRNTMTS